MLAHCVSCVRGSLSLLARTHPRTPTRTHTTTRTHPPARHSFVQECAARGLLVLLDLHRTAAARDIPELWYDAEYKEDDVRRAWRTVVLR